MPIAAVSMKEYGVGYSKAKFVSDGAFGGKKSRPPGKWIGDKSKGTQIANYEKGADFLFFQNPTPKTGFQEKEVNFFSAENFQQAELQGPLRSSSRRRASARSRCSRRRSSATSA